MKYALLGSTGVRASRFAIGTATFGVAPLEEDAGRIIGGAMELGVNIFDCANSYGNQARFDRPTAPPVDQRKWAEEILGAALKGHRNEVIICSKVMERVKPGPNGGGFDGGGLTRLHMMQQVEQSLRRLGTDHIDVLYAHHPDPTTPIEDTLRTFDNLVQQGKIRYYALSTFAAWQEVEAVLLARQHNLHAPSIAQINYNLLNRAAERDLVPVAQKYGITHTVFGPLAGGLLASLEVLERDFTGSQRWGGRGFTEEQIDIARQFNDVAKDTGYRPAHLALAWLTSRPTITTAIIGPENLSELEENLAVAEMDIPDEVLERVDEINRPQRLPF